MTEIVLDLLAGKFARRLFLRNLVQGVSPLLGFECGFGETEDLNGVSLSGTLLARLESREKAVVRLLQGCALGEVRFRDEEPAKLR